MLASRASTASTSSGSAPKNGTLCSRVKIARAFTSGGSAAATRCRISRTGYGNSIPSRWKWYQICTRRSDRMSSFAPTSSIHTFASYSTPESANWRSRNAGAGACSSLGTSRTARCRQSRTRFGGAS